MPLHPFSLSNLSLVFLTAGLLVFLFRLWKKTVRAASPEEKNRFQKPVTRFVLVYAVYAAAITVLAALGFFRVATMPPRFLVIFLPMLLVVVLLSGANRRSALSFLSLVPPAFLIGVHVYRLFIELVFLQFAREGLIPEVLSFHGRNFDLFIGVLALPVAFLFWKKWRLARFAGIVFNVLGLLSLLNIFSIAIRSLPSVFRVYETLYLPLYFPGILIVFLASAAVFLHVLSLRQLLPARQALVTAPPCHVSPNPGRNPAFQPVKTTRQEHPKTGKRLRFLLSLLHRQLPFFERGFLNKCRF
ncbi:hypothetical protein [Flavisolibacter nicotianae]|uniref:hypothetical protein n=1 Tax=Flavisolibacter nicotianae TaxID=2364882 RepID=UPI0013C50FEF|nr:hypothetical protein [Flavisolibacter nicotianae]